MYIAFPQMFSFAFQEVLPANFAYSAQTHLCNSIHSLVRQIRLQ